MLFAQCTIRNNDTSSVILLAGIDTSEKKVQCCHGRNGRGEKEESDMKLALLFAVAALLVACLKGLKRNSKDDTATRFHRLGL